MKRIKEKSVNKIMRAIAVIVFAVVQGSVFGADVTWDGGGGANKNWSDFDNFSDNSDPSGDNVTFNNTGTVGSGTINNIVDSDVSIGDLLYKQYQEGAGTPTNWHNAEISESVTLTVGGDLIVGGLTNSTYSTHTAIVGTGKLLVSGETSKIGVGGQGDTRGGNSEATDLDLRGLGTFEADVQQILIGEIASADLGKYSADPGERSHLYLAETNTIKVDVISLQAASRFEPGSLHLGQSNKINVDNLWLGPPNRIGQMDFDSSWTDPSAILRAKDGESRVSTIAIGWRSDPTRNQRTAGDIDLTGGTVDILVDNLNMGRGRNNDNSDNFGVGVLTFDAGTIDATTINMGGGCRGDADININGTAKLIADTVNLGWQAVSYINRDYVSETFITLGGGRLEATTINPGDDIEPSSLKYSEGGTGIDRGLVFSSGVIANKRDSNLTIDELVPISLIGSAAAHEFEAQAGQMITVNSEISGDGGLYKSGGGTLVIKTNFTYTGTTTLLDGEIHILETVMSVAEAEAAIAAGEIVPSSLTASDIGAYTAIRFPSPGTVILIK